MPNKNVAAHRSAEVTPQTAHILGRGPEMVRNEAGGYTLQVDNWMRLDRFLILGSNAGPEGDSALLAARGRGDEE
jgi:hypothetical protein